MRCFTVVSLDGHRVVEARTPVHLARLLRLFLPLDAREARAWAAALWRGHARVAASRDAAAFDGSWRS